MVFFFPLGHSLQKPATWWLQEKLLMEWDLSSQRYPPPQPYSELVNHSPFGKHSYDGRIAVLNQCILQKGGEAAPEGEKNTLIA